MTAHHSAPAAARPTRRRRRWRPRWQGLARIGLAAGLAGFGAVVFLGVRERIDPAAARGVDRADPDAVVEITNLEITQSAGDLHDYTLRAGRQLTYDDGSLKFDQGFRLTVSEQVDRDSFVVTGWEGRIDENESDIVMTGDIALAASDGLEARSEHATYARTVGIVNMPGPTALARAGMEATGREVVYERSGSAVTLGEAAHVRLTGEEAQADIDIWSARAQLAHTDGYMHFEGGTEVDTGAYLLDAEETTANFGEDETLLERLELRRNARIRSAMPTAGGLQEMGASEVTLEFEETVRALERAVLTGSAAIQLVGDAGAEGARVHAASVDVSMADDGTSISGLEALDGVTLDFPQTADGTRQEITAETFASRGTGAGLDMVEFDRQVRYLELAVQADPAAPTRREIQADRLEAGVKPGLGALLEARFLGNVRFEDGNRTATAEDVIYDVDAGLLSLTTGVDRSRTPVVEDENVRFAADDMTLGLDSSVVEAAGDVRGEITPGNGAEGKTMPALFDPDQRILATAAGLRMDRDVGLATYTGGARLWQGDTSFEGQTLSVDDSTGNLTAAGGIRTNLRLTRVNDTTGESELSSIQADADEFLYDDAANHVLYTGNTVLRSDAGDIKAERTELFLGADSSTLDRLEATGEVRLRLDGRWAVGERLVYYEAEGRYELEGAPVEIIEEDEPEEPDSTQPPPGADALPPVPSCTTTRGRAMTFYRSGDTISVDGREVVRTQSISGECVPMGF